MRLTSIRLSKVARSALTPFVLRLAAWVVKILEGLLSLELTNVGKSRLDGMRDNLACPNSRVVFVLCVRSFRCGTTVEAAEPIVAKIVPSVGSGDAE
jgi:hypothetical protein